MIHAGCQFHNLRSACIDVPWLIPYDDKILYQFHRQFPASLMLNFHVGGVSQEDGHINVHRAPHSLSVRRGLKLSLGKRKQMNEHVGLLCLNECYVHWWDLVQQTSFKWIQGNVTLQEFFER